MQFLSAHLHSSFEAFVQCWSQPKTPSLLFAASIVHSLHDSSSQTDVHRGTVKWRLVHLQAACVLCSAAVQHESMFLDQP